MQPPITYEEEEDDDGGTPLSRQAGPPCDCPLNCYNKIPVSYRKELLRMFWRMDSELKRDAYLAECILFDEGFYTNPKPNQTSPVLHIIKRGNKAVRVCKKAFLGVFGLHRSGRWRVEELEREMVRTKEELRLQPAARKRRTAAPPYVMKREHVENESPEDMYEFPSGGSTPPRGGRITRRSLPQRGRGGTVGRPPGRGRGMAGGATMRKSPRGGTPGGRLTRQTREEPEEEEDEPEQQDVPAEEAVDGEAEEQHDPHALFTDPPDLTAKRPSTAIKTKKSEREHRYMDMMNKVEHVEQHIDVYVTGPLEDYKGKYSGEEELINWSEDDIRHWYNHYVQKYCVEQEYDAVSWELYRKLFKKATGAPEGLLPDDEDVELVGWPRGDDPNKIRLDVDGGAVQEVEPARGTGARTRGGVRTRGGGVTARQYIRMHQEQEDAQYEHHGEEVEDHMEGQEVVEGEVMEQPGEGEEEEPEMETVITQNALVEGVEVIPQDGGEEVHITEQHHHQVVYKEQLAEGEHIVEYVQGEVEHPQEGAEGEVLHPQEGAEGEILQQAEGSGLMPPAPQAIAVTVAGNGDQQMEEIESYVTAAHALQKLSQVAEEEGAHVVEQHHMEEAEGEHVVGNGEEEAEYIHEQQGVEQVVQHVEETGDATAQS